MDIQVDKLFFQYEGADSVAPVLSDISFALRSAECVALLGPSGSGKSTLAQLLNGLLKPNSGRIWADGRLLRWSTEELKALRRRVGLVFQFPEAQIFEATVFNEVAFAARQWGIPNDDISGRVENALKVVGLEPDSFVGRNPSRLSGGEARLISIASLLVVEPNWLILDEPTLGLDLAHWNCIYELIQQSRNASRSVLLITHDLNLVLQVCPRALVLTRGQLTYDGPTADLLINHDLNAEFDLAPPEIINLWKSLKSTLNEQVRSDEFPDPDAEQMQSWIARQSPAQRDRICSVLQQCIRNSMDQYAI